MPRVEALGQVGEVRPQKGEVAMLCGQSVLVLERVQYDELACQLVTEAIRLN